MSTEKVQSVYVHAPFCARRCVYCDFAVTVRRTGDSSSWLDALRCELRHVSEEGLFSLGEQLRTLYVGGGTPSLLGPAAMAGLSEVIGESRLAASDLEWTAEANPESLTPEVVAAWAAAGVNRLSLGAQTFHAEALAWMGRLHGVAGPLRALEAARAAGIVNVSVDLIFGLPQHLGRSWDHDLEQVLALEVPHVSLYGLTVESGTALGRAVREGREQPVEEEQYRAEFLRAAEVLTAAGYRHYEVSNFALAGAESRHNTAYWDDVPYLGLGNGAHSYIRPVRRWNERDWETYRARVLAGNGAEAERETLGQEALDLEAAWLGLRRASGVGEPETGTQADELVRGWCESGLATRADGRVRLTVEGWLVLDRLAVDLDEARVAG